MPLEGPDVLLYEKKDHIVTITINRPERMNALTIELYDKLDEAWERFNQDDDAFVAIWTAAGFQFSMMCDLKVAADTARFGVGEVKVGRGTPWAIPVLWQMPLPIAFEVLMMGNPVPAQRMYDVGWVNRVVPLDQLMPTAMELAQVLAENAPLSIRCAKEAMYKAMDVGRKEGIEAAKKIYEKVYNSEDAIEGPRAFAEKRKPVWKGR